MTSNEQLALMVDSAWGDVRRDFIYPVLQSPGTSAQTAGVPGAVIKDSVILNLPFIQHMEGLGIPAERVARLLLARTVNQYLRVPRTFAEYLRLYRAVRENVYAEQPAERILNAYFDLWNELDLHERGYAPSLEEVYPPIVRSLGSSGEEAFFRVLVAILALKWTANLGVELSGVHKTLSLRLAELRYVDCPDRAAEIRSFSSLLSRVFSFVQVQASGGVGTPSTGTAKPAEPVKPHWPLGDSRKTDLVAASLGNVKGGIERFVGELHDESVSDLLLEAVSRLGIGTGIGTTQYTPGRWWWYGHLARKYPSFEVAEKESDCAAPCYPVDYVDLSLSDNLAEYALFPSLGKLWPGLAKRFVRTGAESGYNQPTIPQLLIVLDSSGSMPDPNQKLSYAVLSGFLAANAYLDLGSQVAVYNFSNAGSDIFLSFTDDDVQIYKHIAAYQGGGTTLNEGVLEKLLHEGTSGGRDVDLLLISDMGIANVEGLAKKLASYAGMHRVSLFFVRDACGNFGALSAQLCESPNVSVFKISEDRDLPNLVLGSVQDSLRDAARETSGVSS